MTDSGPNPETGTPRWVLVTVIVAVIAVLLLVVVALSGRGGSHGPGRHTGTPAGVTH